MDTNERAVMDALRDAPRCERYTPDYGSLCDGLDGCEECLFLAARTVLRMLGVRS